MRHASLFSGIGGFDLAAQWMGWENVFQVEKDTFCQKVLAKNFPHTKRYGDIKEFDGTKYRGAVDILTGGFPCQPFSTAGERRGTEDERHLWPEMRRVIREVAPAYIVGENVLGLVSWSKGLVFEQVHADLEADGYEVQAFVLPAAGVNAPHQRYRIWFVAHAVSERCGEKRPCINEVIKQRSGGYIEQWDSSNTNKQGLEVRERQRRHDEQEFTAAFGADNRWERWPTQPGVCGGNDGVPNRVDRIKSLGNAIVPQVAYQIFKAIEAI